MIICAPARRCTCICRVRTGACGTQLRWAQPQEVILCEALIDALTFWCAGYRNVTASYGVEGFTADHLVLFKQCGIERVLIAYDRDEAGENAAQKLAAQLTAAGLDCYRILFPKGLDANEYALKVGPAAKSLGVAIRSAQWLGKGVARGTGLRPAGLHPALTSRNRSRRRLSQRASRRNLDL